MRLSNKQAFILVEILRATIKISNLSGYDSKTRLGLYNDIMNQQSSKLVDLDKWDRTSAREQPRGI